MPIDVEEAVKRLQNAGFKVTNGSEMITVRFGVGELTEQLIPALKITRVILEDDGLWSVIRWDYVPGPGYDDIVFGGQTLEHAVDIVIAWHFGSPTVLNGWIIPLHKHPEWSLDQIRVLLENAPTLPLAEWKPLQAAYTKKRPPWGTEEEVFACLFNPIAHNQNDQLTLYLRRDLQEAYIVEMKGADK